MEEWRVLNNNGQRQRVPFTGKNLEVAGSQPWQCVFFFFFRGTPVAYEGSQARGTPAAILEVPRLGVKSELQLPAYATATAMQDPSCVFDLHHNSW